MYGSTRRHSVTLFDGLFLGKYKRMGRDNLTQLPQYIDFINSDDYIGNISSISIRSDHNLFEILIFGSVKLNYYAITLDQ